ncbi:hypothetical protein EYV94_11520 [Puteibacter caeruleilacunae]|nr:hypothetical protein EYV94_11520 [Puteibacter caeruleilacunae]
MEKINKIVAFCVLSFVVLFGVWQFKFSSGKKYNLPEEVELLSISDKIYLKEKYFDNSPKVVVYLYDDCMHLLQLWKPYIEKYSDIRFVFYINSVKKDKIREQLRYYKFKYPVFWDSKGQFAKSNSLPKEIAFISYILNGDDELISTRNPTYGDYEVYLKQVLD